MIECLLCGKKFNRITPTHLKYKHQTTMKEYHIMFPNAEITSEECRYNLKIWNKGLTKETNERLRSTSRNMTGEKNSMFGRTGELNPMFGRKGELNPSFGKHLSIETGRKMSISRTGKTGELCPMFGKHHTPETKQKMREHNWMKGRKGELSPSFGRTGPLSPNWLGGISFEPYTPEFNDELKEIIRTQDYYTCQICGAKENEHELCVHHIDYDKENNDLNNLISLCVSCHMKTNYDRERWKKILTKLVIKRNGKKV